MASIPRINLRDFVWSLKGLRGSSEKNVSFMVYWNSLKRFCFGGIPTLCVYGSWPCEEDKLLLSISFVSTLSSAGWLIEDVNNAFHCNLCKNQISISYWNQNIITAVLLLIKVALMVLLQLSPKGFQFRPLSLHGQILTSYHWADTLWIHKKNLVYTAFRTGSYTFLWL